MLAAAEKAVYLALAIQADGHRDILGLWVEQTEGAKFWMKVFADLQALGCRDMLIASGRSRLRPRPRWPRPH